MRLLLTIFFLFAFVGIATAAVVDDFEDGDYTNDPTWTLSTDCGGAALVQDVNFVYEGTYSFEHYHTGACNQSIIYTPVDENVISAYVLFSEATGRAYFGYGTPGAFQSYAILQDSVVWGFTHGGAGIAGTYTALQDTQYRIRIDVNEDGGRAILYNAGGTELERLYKMGTISSSNVLVGTANATGGGFEYFDYVVKGEELIIDVNSPVASAGYTTNFLPFQYRIYDSTGGCSSFNLDVNNFFDSDANLLVRHTAINSDAIDANYTLFNDEGSQRLIFTGVCATDSSLSIILDMNITIDLNAPIMYLFDSNTNIGWDVNSVISTNLGCTDTGSSTLNYLIQNNGAIIYDNNVAIDTNVLLNSVLANGVNDLNVVCTDEAGRTATDQNSFDVHVKEFALINEDTGALFDLALVDSLIATEYDTNSQYDFKTNNDNIQTLVWQGANTVRFDINYLDNTQIFREFSLGLLDDENNVRVCVAPLQTLYELLLTSGASTGVWLVNNFADCYSLVDYTKYAFQGAQTTTAFTINDTYYLYTISEDITNLLSLIDGSKAATVNLDLLEFNQEIYDFTTITDEIATAKTSETSVMIHYESITGGNSQLDLTIYDGTNEVFSYTETANPNEFTTTFDYSSIDLDSNVLRLEVVKTLNSGETETITRYFSPQLKTFGILDPYFAALLAIFLMILGFTLITYRAVFNWFGILVAIGGIAILGFATDIWFIPFLQGIAVIILLFIAFVYKDEGVALT